MAAGKTHLASHTCNNKSVAVVDQETHAYLVHRPMRLLPNQPTLVSKPLFNVIVISTRDEQDM
jgi:hypothetical protein